MRFRAACAAVLLLVGCSSPADPTPDAGADTAGDVQTQADLAECGDTLALAVSAEQTLEGEGDCTVTVQLETDALAEITANGAALRLDDEATDEPNWLAPGVLAAGSHTLEITASDAWSIAFQTYGPPVEIVERDRSLVWTDPALVDDPQVVGLARVMDVVAPGQGAALFAWWLRRFATTAHSERVGPQQYLEQIEAEHGVDPAAWDLDALNFKVTAVHNRTDLANASSCGELRVSIASTDPVFQPFHAIFLFEQAAGPGDVSPAGAVHCGATLRRWARLSQMDATAFLTAAREIANEAIQPERFIIAETVEFIISPWEWRQWRPIANPDPVSPLTRVFENPPLFQTIDAPRLNRAGATRDAFLSFVSDNAAALDARAVALPEQFRGQSARVNAGVPWVPLDLSGADADAISSYPELRQNIEIIGCPACHATDADFIQTRTDRTFSPFYDKELDARARHLEDAHRGAGSDVPFGPLQGAPLLPP